MKVIILSGTSCVGKTPLLNALSRVYPEFPFSRPLLYTSRARRPVEEDGRDYYFRSEREIRNLDKNQFAIAKTRHIWQAVDVNQLIALVGTTQVVIYDIYPTLARELVNHPRVRSENKMKWQRIFIQPASFDDIYSVRRAMGGSVSMQEALAAIQVPKLIKRAQNQGIELTRDVMQDISIRAQTAWEEVLLGREYDHVIINHDGEESQNWEKTPPVGEAGKTLKKFYKLATNGDGPSTEARQG